MNSRESIEKKIAAFPAMPAMCGYLLSKIRDPNLDFKELADQVKYDPGLTANILKLANSAYFGARGEVDSIQTAVVRLGLIQVFQLVTAAAAGRVLRRELVGYKLTGEDLLRHSVWVAVASGELADALGVQAPDVIFTAGLLHDIGKIALDEVVAAEESGLRVAMADIKSWDSFEQIEERFFGMNHAEAGARILEKWKFPEVLVSAVRWHHTPAGATGMHEVVNMVHVADQLAYTHGIGAGIEGLHYELSEHAVKGLDIKHSLIERSAGRALDKMRELEAVLGGYNQ